MDDQLESLKGELKESIEKAKKLALSCKVGRYEESEFRVDGNGVLYIRRRS